ncbi:hypothetical protein FI667_g12093, partial [Globisporangium splendens]
MHRKPSVDPTQVLCEIEKLLSVDVPAEQAQLNHPESFASETLDLPQVAQSEALKSTRQVLLCNTRVEEQGERSAGGSASGSSSALEPTTEPPATTSSETITDTPPSTAESASFDSTPFVFSRIDKDLSISELKALADTTASMYMQSVVQCAAASKEEDGCFMRTAMAKALHGRLSEVVLDMNVLKDSSEKRTDATETSHSMVSLIGFSTFGLAVLVYAAKQTKDRRHGYAAIPNGTESINAETI